MSHTRTETDSMGKVEVAQEVYWGAQTQRSIENFSIGRDKLPIEVIYALALVKKAAAQANYELGILSEHKKELIIQAADQILDKQVDNAFPLHVWMTGSGTQANMNVNEVVSNIAIEMVGGVLGSKNPIHPNDDVNKSQSTNDVFPTAMHIATALAVTERLLPAVKEMQADLVQKSKDWADITKIGRTHMQDAVPITLGQEFSGYAELLRKGIERIEQGLVDVYELTLGGTAVGTGLNAPDGFDIKAIQHIIKYTGLPFTRVTNKFAAQGSHDALVAMMGHLKTLAVSLAKIAADITLLSCGPRAGFNEILLPENEPGSSIMPGKINPTQCEALAMVSVQVMGYDAAVSHAGSAGYLEMNVFKPLIIFNIIQSIHCLSDSCVCFTRKLLHNARPNHEKIKQYLHDSLMLVTALNPLIGYDKASEMAHYAHQKGVTLADANKHFQYLKDEDFRKAVDPYRMTRGGLV